MDALGSAILLGTSLTQFYSDAVGEARTGFYYWVRFVSEADVDGPYNATSGVYAQTSPSPDKLLELLTGEITDSQLYNELSRSIWQIGINGDEAAADALAAALATHSESKVRAADILQESSKRTALDGSVQALYTVRAEVTAGGRTIVGGFGLSATATANEGPRIDFGVRADRFWVGAPASSTGVADSIPFVVQTTPTVINGEPVPAGVYMDTVFIKNGTLTSAQIGSLTATKITAGYTASVDLEAGTFAGSEFYIGGTVSYRYDNPLLPTQRTGIAGVANPNVALNADGATFVVDYFRVKNGSGFSVPFEVVNGVVKIKKASIGDADIDSAKIYDILRSNDFNGTYIEGGPSPDPNYSSVVLLMHCDAGAPYADSSSRARSPEVGGVQTGFGGVAGSGSIVGRSTSTTVGSAFLVFPSSIDFNLRGTFTLEFSVRWITGQTNGYFMARDATSYMQIDENGALTATNWAGGIPTIQLTSGVLHKITVRGNGTHVFFYRDQTLIETHLAALRLDATPFGIFGVPGRGDLPSPQCELDEFRWTQDVDRYGGVPPVQTAAFPGGPVQGYFSSYGTAGWAIAKSGDIIANSLYSRGAVAGGNFSTDDWAWPTAGNGFHVGAQGIRLGREASGQFFEVSSGGAVRAPGLTIADGTLTFDGDATFGGTLSGPIVETQNIIGAGVTTGYSAATAGLSLSITVSVPAGSSMLLVIAYLGEPYELTVGTGKDAYKVTAIPGATLTINDGDPLTSQTGTLIYGIPTPAVGSQTILVERDSDSGSMNLNVLLTKR